MKKITVLGLGILTLLVLAAFFLQQRSLQALRQENAALQADRAVLTDLQAENARLTQTQGDAEELERLRKERAELLRLRGEVGELRRQLAEALARKPVAAAPPAPEPVPPPVEIEPPVSTYVAMTRGAVGWNQTLITGGWQTKPGKRALFLVEPQAVGEDGQPGQVMIQTRVIEMPEELFSQLGLDAIRSERNDSSTQAILTTEQTAQLLGSLQNAPGVDVLAAPRITTADGRQAQVKAVDQKSTAAGQSYEVGPSVDIIPRIAPDGSSVDLTVIARLHLSNQP